MTRDGRQRETFDVSVLGPVHVGAGPALRGRQASLATILAFHAPDVVPQDELVVRLLGSGERARVDELRVLVSRLRRQLREAGSTARVEREASGYVLAGGSTDVDRFEHLVALAVRTRPTDANEASGLFRRAADVWRGDVAGELADHPVAVRLDERRLFALTAHFELEVDAGRHQACLADLLATCRRFVHHEGLHRVAMVALYRCGRQADALALYRDVRARLVEELGAEPGLALQQAELMILRHDVGDVAVAPPPVARYEVIGAEHATPWMGATPSYPDSYVADPSLLSRVRRALAQPGPVTVVGTAGVGKTRLVAQLLGEMAGERRAFCALAAVDGPTLAMTVAGALGARVPTGHDPVAAIVERLGDDRWTVVLDTCEHLRRAAADLVAAVVARCPGVTLVATSRVPLGVPGEDVIEVAPLAVPAAVRLFAARAAPVGGTWAVGSVDPMVEELCRQLDGVPLAIELAAARSRAFSPSELVHLLDRRLTLLQGPSSDGRSSGLRASLEWSYSLLTERQQLVFRALGVFAGPVDRAGVEEVVADAAGGDVAVVLADLVDHSLVVARRHGNATSYSLLDSTRAFAEALLAESSETEHRRQRHADFVVGRKDALLWPGAGGDERDAVDELERLWTDVRAAIGWALDREQRATACALVAGLGESALLREKTEVRAWARAALALPAVAGPVRAAEAHAAAAVAHWTFGEFADGVAQTDQAWARAVADGVGLTVDIVLGAVLNAAARHMPTFAEQARHLGELAAAFGNPLAHLWALNGEGMAHAYHGRFPEALDVLAAAEQLAVRADSRSQLAMCQFARTIALLDDDPHAALTSADAAIANAGEVRATWVHGAVANYRAAALVRAGEPTVAIAEVRALCRRLADGGTVQSVANTVRNAIALIDRLGRPERAVGLLAWLDANPVGVPGTPGMRRHVDDLRARLQGASISRADALTAAAGAGWSHGEAARAVLACLGDER